MIKRILGQISLSLLLFSCAESPMDFQEDNAADDFGGAVADRKMTILKERNPEYPWEPVVYKSHRDTATSRSAQQLTHPDYLGYSYRNDFYPIEDSKNLGYRVINTPKLSADFPTYFQSWKSPSAEAKYFSYASFDEYLSKSTTTKKVSSGFSLDFKIFSIGNKTNYTDVFTKEVSSNDKFVFGELNIAICDSCHRMQYSTNIRDRISKDYIDPVFFEEYHCLHPYELFKDYGGFVVRDFITGGKATALYLGLYKKDSTADTKTRDMGTEISSTFMLNSNANLSLGRGKNSVISTTNEFSSVTMSVKTLGGTQVFPNFTDPTEVGNTHMDLSSWMASLENKSTTSIIEFNNEGLIPITDFILEENIKTNISEYIQGVIPQISQTEPQISYQVIYLNSQVVIYGHLLETRNGDRLYLGQSVFLRETDQKTINDELSEWSTRYANMFDIKAVNYDYNGKQFSYCKKAYVNIAEHISIYKKTIYNNILYIIDEIDHAGFSIPNDALYINQYGLKDAVSKMEESCMTYQELFDEFTINAL